MSSRRMSSRRKMRSRACGRMRGDEGSRRRMKIIQGSGMQMKSRRRSSKGS